MSVIIAPNVMAKAKRLRLEREASMREATARQLAADTPTIVSNRFGDWLVANNPGVVRGHPEWRWDYRHHVLMQKLLDRVTSGACKRAKFQIPIRHTKSEHNTIAYAVYRLKRNPRLRILIVSYDQDQANDFSLSARRFAEYCGIAFSRDKNAVSDWETTEGGRLKAIGINGGFASKGFDLIIIDDPIGRRADAESQAHRNMVWDTITNDILARCEPTTSVIFTMSRWNQDDPAARIDQQFPGMWETIDLPGEAEGPDKNGVVPKDPLGRKPGAPLWPEFRGSAWLAEKRVELLEYGYLSLIQGRPRPRMGGMFKWDRWKLLDYVPRKGLLIRYWDMAGTRPKGNEHDPDYTAGVMERRWPTRPDGTAETSIAHVIRFRVEVAARDDMIVARAKKDLKQYGSNIIYWFERQAGIGGTEASHAVEQRVRNLGIAVESEYAGKSKAERARPLASACLAGDVYLEPDDTEEPWHDAFRNEAADFTGNGDKHDDMVDGASGAFNKLGADEYQIYTTM